MHVSAVYWRVDQRDHPDDLIDCAFVADGSNDLFGQAEVLNISLNIDRHRETSSIDPSLF